MSLARLASLPPPAPKKNSSRVGGSRGGLSPLTGGRAGAGGRWSPYRPSGVARAGSEPRRLLRAERGEVILVGGRGGVGLARRLLARVRGRRILPAAARQHWLLFSLECLLPLVISFRQAFAIVAMSSICRERVLIRLTRRIPALLARINQSSGAAKLAGEVFSGNCPRIFEGPYRVCDGLILGATPSMVGVIETIGGNVPPHMTGIGCGDHPEQRHCEIQAVH